MSRNRKIPYTRRIEYEEENQQDELDANDITISVPDRAKPPCTKPNSFDLIKDGNDDASLSLTSKLLKCCCGDRCWKNTESYDKSKFPHPFRSFDLIATIGSILFFFYDVVTDVFLAHNYYSLKRWTEFGFTTAFIVFPMLVINLKSLRWYHLDYNREKGRGYTSCIVWFLRAIFTFPLMIGPVVRHIEYLYHGCKSRSASLSEEERKNHYKQMLHEDTDAGMMRMLEAFLESAPQLVLQMYIILTETPDDGLLMSIIRPVSMVGSWIGVSWSLVSYHKALRASHNEEETGLSLFGTIFYYIWRACEVGPRVVVLALFASQFQYYMLIAVAVHWAAMSIWVALQKPEFYRRTIDKIVFDIVIGYLLIFCFQNVQSGHTRYRAMLYYFVIYAENLAMLVAWQYITTQKSAWYYFAALGIIPGGIVIHIVVQLLYYKCCHPKSMDIVCCINPIQNYNCYQSVCHEIQSNEESKADTGVKNGHTFDV
ncbi:XK-related protein 6-like [Mytilus trossulus]|uniref:XK-related protein 6-like n=1 Tax=Mytilus trossulus TaxID=6551 RepID=UPI0030069965